MTFQRGERYWIEHPTHGTMLAVCEIVSTNQNSLAFRLPQPILTWRQGKDDAVLGTALLLLRTPPDPDYIDIFARDRWKIFEVEPAVKIPTK